MSSVCSAAGVPVGGNGSVCPCAGLLVLMALVAVGLLPPAFSPCPHAPPGRKAWWNAKAGPAMVVSIGAEANVAAKNNFTLLKMSPFPHFRATMVYTPFYLCRIISE
jgi:hypothetical protein